MLIAVSFFASHVVQGQTQPVVQPTSATDPKVKVHSPRKLFSFNHNQNLRKYKSHSRVTEREGHSLPKQRPRSRYRTRESDVYKRQQYDTRKDKSTRSKLKIYKKHSMARN